MQTNIVYNKSCLTMEEIEDNSVDTIVTSCPYWGLRDYGEGANQIWGGDEDCKHQWKEIDILRKATPGDLPSPKSIIASRRTNAENRPGKPSQFCQPCGAWYGQLGLEPTLEMYIEHLLLITLECKRVLKPTGVLWWNHGDSYYNASKWTYKETGHSWDRSKELTPRGRIQKTGLMQEKCLCLQNFRLIIRLIDEQGWVLRNTAIWNKPNSMPSSTKDRLTNKYEPVFFLVKNTKTQYYWNEKTGLMANRKSSPLQENIDWEWIECPKCNGVGKIIEGIKAGSDDFGIVFSEKGPEICPRCKGARKIKHSFWHSLDYWFDLDAIREKQLEPNAIRPRMGQGNQTVYNQKRKGIQVPGQSAQGIHRKRHSGYYGANGEYLVNPSGKNPGDVWTIPTQPYPEAHFATFPEKLIIKPILSSCPEWVCKRCGKARVRIRESDIGGTIGHSWHNHNDDMGKGNVKKQTGTEFKTYNRGKTIGWTDCGCNVGWRPGIVLDPFAGRGTTLAMAKRFDRQFIGYEIVKSYIPLIRKSLEKEDTMFNRDIKEQFL